jgi:hypothetical protein
MSHREHRETQRKKIESFALLWLLSRVLAGEAGRGSLRRKINWDWN